MRTSTFPANFPSTLLIQYFINSKSIHGNTHGSCEATTITPRWCPPTSPLSRRFGFIKRGNFAASGQQIKKKQIWTPADQLISTTLHRESRNTIIPITRYKSRERTAIFRNGQDEVEWKLKQMSSYPFRILFLLFPCCRQGHFVPQRQVQSSPNGSCVKFRYPIVGEGLGSLGGRHFCGRRLSRRDHCLYYIVAKFSRPGPKLSSQNAIKSKINIFYRTCSASNRDELVKYARQTIRKGN